MRKYFFLAFHKNFCCVFQSCINQEGDKFVEYHKDKNDPTLDAEMTREVTGDELIVVR